MAAPVPYLLFPGTAREALTFYRDTFGGELTLHTFGEFGRDDGPVDAIAHGVLAGPVAMYGADAADEEPFASSGLMFSLLGTTTPAGLRSWFAALAQGGSVLDELEARAWNATDGQVRDGFGLRWLVGFEHAGPGDPTDA
jgi:PhnB protein